MTEEELKKLLDFIQDNFKSFGDFHDFYRKHVFPKERELRKGMWK